MDELIDCSAAQVFGRVWQLNSFIAFILFFPCFLLHDMQTVRHSEDGYIRML